MQKKARTSEIILGLVIVLILNISAFVYCKIYNRKKNETKIKEAVNI